ncbi:MAG: hypothetical protein GY861_00585 [bacterium]|nr:hypothetical protein [bacterium]
MKLYNPIKSIMRKRSLRRQIVGACNEIMKGCNEYLEHNNAPTGDRFRDADTVGIIGKSLECSIAIDDYKDKTSYIALLSLNSISEAELEEKLQELTTDSKLQKIALTGPTEAVYQN